MHHVNTNEDSRRKRVKNGQNFPPMKKAILLYLIILPALVFAQFPAPDSFQVSVHYITMDQSDWCAGQLVQGPAYCNLFSWQAPDTANTPATLTEYRIYKDNEIFLSTSDTDADTAGMYLGSSFYVTAIYEDPAGESEPSNVVVIGDLPMATGAVQGSHQIEIGFDLSRQVLIIQGAEYARALRVYDMQGGLVFSTDAVPAVLRVEGLRTGIYGVIVQDRQGRIWNKLALLTD